MLIGQSDLGRHLSCAGARRLWWRDRFGVEVDQQGGDLVRAFEVGHVAGPEQRDMARTRQLPGELLSDGPEVVEVNSCGNLIQIAQPPLP